MEGKRLAELRKRHKISQEKLALVLNVSRSTVAMWENSSNEPDNKTLKLIAEYFSVSTDYLLGSSTEEKRKPTDNGEPLKENVVIFYRDGKTVTKEFTEEQMDIITKLLNEIPEKPKNV